MIHVQLTTEQSHKDTTAYVYNSKFLKIVIGKQMEIFLCTESCQSTNNWQKAIGILEVGLNITVRIAINRMLYQDIIIWLVIYISRYKVILQETPEDASLQKSLSQKYIHPIEQVKKLLQSASLNKL